MLLNKKNRIFYREVNDMIYILLYLRNFFFFFKLNKFMKNSIMPYFSLFFLIDTHTHTHTHTRARTLTHTHTHTHTHAHTHTHTHIHTQTFSRKRIFRLRELRNIANHRNMGSPKISRLPSFLFEKPKSNNRK